MSGPLELARQMWLETPPVTRWYTLLCLGTTVLVDLGFLSPFQLYFHPSLIVRGQIWRLFTSFLFFGPLGFNFVFNMIFTCRYCRLLEENSFRNRRADFVYMLLLGASAMALIAFFIDMLFLGQAFTMMLVYVWARRNPAIIMNFFGLLTFQAPYLPWVLLGFSLLLGNSVSVDLMGMAVGHIYYFLEDVFPNQPGGFRMLVTPTIIKVLCDDPLERDQHHEHVPEPQERPGGFQWGNQQLGEQQRGEQAGEQAQVGQQGDVMEGGRRRQPYAVNEE